MQNQPLAPSTAGPSRTWRSSRAPGGRPVSRWLLTAPEGMSRDLPRPIRAANFAVALALVAFALYWPFTQLVATWNWADVYRFRAKFYEGFLLTVVLSLAALILSTVIGLASALAGRSRLLLLRYLNKIYIDLMRGTPFLVQILIFFYVMAAAVGINDRNTAGVLVLSIFSGAYISEVVRGGIESVGKSQLESAKAIGLTTAQTYRFVIFPQAWRQIMPSMAGQFVSIVKDSSLLSVISINEFTRNVEETSANTFGSLECYIPLAVGYLILTLPIAVITRRLEGRNRFET